MAEEIRADYQQMEQVAKKFAQQSHSIQQMLTKVKSSMSKLQTGWQGKGSSAFFAEMNGKVIPASQRLQQALNEASRAAKDISNTIKQAEDDAGSPFRSS